MMPNTRSDASTHALVAATLLLASVGCASTASAGKDATSQSRQTITIPSGDGLPITADLYITHPRSAPLIVLFHQAGWSRGEYRTTAPRLNKLGFNCIAIDQRSGGKVNGVANQTAKRAKAAGKATRYVDAIQDMRAALAYGRKHYTDGASGRVIAWGSSYSAALVLNVVGDDASLADAVMSFSPGEYFASQGKPKHWIRTAAAKLKVPVFITSAKSEKSSWSAIFDAIPTSTKRSYLPTTPGNHGSRALWKKFSDNAGYWHAVEAFLKTL